MIGLCVLAAVPSAHAAPLPSLPADFNGKPRIGGGELTTLSGNGSLVDFNLNPIDAAVFAFRLTVKTVDATYHNAPGIGEVKLFAGSTPLTISKVAASAASWFGESAADKWYEASSAPRGDYGIGNVVDGSPGTVNDNYTSVLGKSGTAVQVGDVLTVYAALANPQQVTKAQLGTGTNRNFTYQVDIFALDAISVPEPNSAALLALALGATAARRLGTSRKRSVG